MSKISELTDGGSLLPTDFLIAVRSGGNVKVQADDITVDQIRLGDNEKIELGNSQDLQIYHDGTNSYIKDNGTGRLAIQSASDFLVANTANTQNYIYAVESGAVNLYHSGVKKFETTATGIDVTGSVTASGNIIPTGGSATAGSIWKSGANLLISMDTGGLYVNNSANTITALQITDAGDVGIGNSGVASTRLAVTNSVVGVNIETTSSTAGHEALIVNRQNSDGIAIAINKAGATVGSIGSRGGVVSHIILDPRSGGAGLTAAGASLFPTNNAGAVSDGAIDLGYSVGGTNYRFKNLYLSGNASMGSLSPGVVTISSGSYFIGNATNGYRFNNAADTSNLMILQDSGNLLVGKNSLEYENTAGHIFRGDGLQSSIRSGGNVADFNRIGSSGTEYGEVIRLSSNGTTVGSISVVDSDPTGGGGEVLVASGNTGLKFDDQANYIRPANASGGGRDNIIDLGNSSNRFKDLYLSGKVQASYIYRSGADGSGLHFTTNAIYPTNENAGISDGTETLGAAAYRFKDFWLSGKIAKGTGGELDLRSDGGGFEYKQNLDVATAGCTFTGASTRGDMASISLYQTATGADGGYIKFNTSNSGSTTPTEKARILSDGSFLIGITSQSLSTSFKIQGPNEASKGFNAFFVSMGNSGGGYPYIGYNCAPTTTGSTYNRYANDYASWIDFHAGGIRTFTSAGGTGNTSGSAGPYVSQGGTSWTSSSDQRLKDDVQEISYGLDTVKALEPVSYVRNDRDVEGRELGFIAQGVEGVVDEIVNVDDTGYYGLNYQGLIPILTKAIQEQQATIEALEARITALES